MASEIPDLDEDVSFIVDNGASVGPIPMREIIASISSGERSSTSLVWWAGATDWCRFDSVNALVALVTPAVPPLPPALQTPLPPTPTLKQVGQSPTAEEPAPVEEPAPAEELVPAEEPAHVSPAHAMASQDAVAAEEVASEVVSPDALDFEPLGPVTSIVQPQHAMPAPGVQTGAVSDATEAVEVTEQEQSTGLPARESENVDTEADAPRPALTGLFSSGSRLESPEAEMPSADALDAILAARVSLESVGARIEALSSATRPTLTPEEFQAGLDEFEATAADDAEQLHAAEVQATDVTAPAEDNDVADPGPADDGGAWTTVDGDAQGTKPSTAGVDLPRSREQLDERFQEMVRKSVDHQRRIEWIMRVDELLLSACITNIADSGFVAMDLASSNSDHRVLFSHNDDSRQVRLELTPLDSAGDQLGRHVRFGLSWGKDVRDVNGAFEVVRQNASEGPLPSGVLGSEIEMATATVLTNVELILAADDFVKDDYSVDRTSLSTAIAAALQALEAHWHDLFADF